MIFFDLGIDFLDDLPLGFRYYHYCWQAIVIAILHLLVLKLVMIFQVTFFVFDLDVLYH